MADAPAFAPPPASPAAISADVAGALAALDASWSVFASPRVGLDQPDFLAVHDRFGVCVMDVLDWTPETTCILEDGRIARLGTDNRWAAIAFDPRVRAARSRSAIFDQFSAMPEHGGSATSAVRSVILLPAFTTAAAGALFARMENDHVALVQVSGGDAVASSIGEVVRGFGCQLPPAPSIDKLRRHVATSPDVLERRSWDASTPPAIIDIAENASQRRHRRIDGAVGTGKSSALAARAARLAADDKRVLALSFNVTFANGLRSMIDGYCNQIGADPTLVSCSNFHSFCTRVVSDAEMEGAELPSTRGAPWTVAIVEKATEAYRQGRGPRFDAVMIDEGQDFTELWWSLLREHVLVEGGETLLTVDRTQDIYERTEWLDDDSGVDAVGVETVTLSHSLRLPTDLLELTNEFATTHLDGDLHLPVPVSEPDPGQEIASVRRWGDVARVKDIGTAVGQEVVELLRSDPSLRPGDVAFVCDYHHDGVRASAVIERAGIPVHHIFSRDPDDPRRRRKHRFWTDADAVKGCTAHSLKGWDTPAVVLSIGSDHRAKRLAYVTMTRVRHSIDRPAIISVVNADTSLRPFGERFVAGSAALGASVPAVQKTTTSTGAPVDPAPAPTPGVAPAPPAPPPAPPAPASPVPEIPPAPSAPQPMVASSAPLAAQPHPPAAHPPASTALPPPPPPMAVPSSAPAPAPAPHSPGATFAPPAPG